MDTDNEQAQPMPIALSIPANASAIFSNATQVTVADDSVILQFAYVRPNSQVPGDQPAGQLVAEIALSPTHAIQFSRALDATIKEHFTRHLDPLA